MPRAARWPFVVHGRARLWREPSGEAAGAVVQRMINRWTLASEMLRLTRGATATRATVLAAGRFRSRRRAEGSPARDEHGEPACRLPRSTAVGADGVTPTERNTCGRAPIVETDRWHDGAYSFDARHANPLPLRPSIASVARAGSGRGVGRARLSLIGRPCTHRARSARRCYAVTALQRVAPRRRRPHRPLWRFCRGRDLRTQAAEESAAELLAEENVCALGHVRGGRQRVWDLYLFTAASMSTRQRATAAERRCARGSGDA